MEMIRMLLFAAVAAFAAGGCVFSGGTTFEQAYANLLALYQAGKIDAQELTARQEMLRYREGQALARAARREQSGGQSSSSDDTICAAEDEDKKKEQNQCPRPPCPPPPPPPPPPPR